MALYLFYRLFAQFSVIVIIGSYLKYFFKTLTGQSLSALGFLQIYHNKRAQKREIIGIYYLGTIVWKNYLPKISAVGLFSYDKFEETPSEKVINMSKLTKPYFNATPLDPI